MRPVLIDEADGPCEICSGWASKKGPKDGVFFCDQCGGPIPDLGLMRGRGFDSVRPHHFHLRGIGPAGVPGRVSIHQELCPTCYLEHRQGVYPGLDASPWLDPSGKAVQDRGK